MIASEVVAGLIVLAGSALMCACAVPSILHRLRSTR